MNKIDFCECMRVLRNFAEWERKMYDCGFDVNSTPVGDMAEYLQGAMCNFNSEYDYDEKLGINWIIEWTYTPDSPNFSQKRHGVEFELSDAGALYDFLVFMNEHGWED